jgi:hypothetical protein
VCHASLEADEQVIGMSREVPKENTGRMDVEYQSEAAYVHPDHEREAAGIGFRRRSTGTLMELETKRNPNLHK